ncbi:MAG: hypothetical protein ACI3ZR_05865 [bacterium]
MSFDLQLFAETPSTDNILLGAGAIFFNRLDDSGKPTGERHLGNCSNFSLTVETEKIQKYNSMTAARTVYKEAIKQIKSTGKITVDEYAPANLALALLGEEGVYIQEEKTVTDTDITAIKGCYASLEHRLVSEVVVKNNEKTYEVNKDYLVDSKIGRIKILSEGDIADNEELKVSYKAAACTLPKIAGGTKGKIEGFLRFVGDPTCGPAYEGRFWKVSVSPDGDMAFIGDDFASFGLNFECMDDSANHPKEPLYSLILM